MFIQIDEMTFFQMQSQIIKNNINNNNNINN